LETDALPIELHSSGDRPAFRNTTRHARRPDRGANGLL